MAAFTIDTAGLEQASNELGLDHPVEVRIVQYGRNSGEIGAYTGLREGQHRISVANDISRRLANSTILHELAHAKQAEEVGWEQLLLRQDAEEDEARPTRGFLATFLEIGRHRSTPLEREADEIARQMTRGIRVVRRA